MGTKYLVVDQPLDDIEDAPAGQDESEMEPPVWCQASLPLLGRPSSFAATEPRVLCLGAASADKLIGHPDQLDVVVLGDPAHHVEGLVGVDFVAFHQDALSLPDDGSV
jgi:hypothetical protein